MTLNCIKNRFRMNEVEGGIAMESELKTIGLGSKHWKAKHSVLQR